VLNTNQHLVAYLVGKTDLGLTTRQPTRMNFCYLDPHHRGRRYDSSTVGDQQAQPL
jgi:hypothetical protein